MPGGSDAVSNPGTNESFDALIDLLGSDDVVQDPRFGNPSNHGLRDDDGKLHLGKIHTFFSGGQDDGEHHAVPVPSGDDLEEQSEIDHSSPEGDKSPVQRSSPASPQNIAGDNIRNNHPLDTQILIDLESDLLSPLVVGVCLTVPIH
ncbi:hypothetical protein PILCRDRAFT_827841 [Piloderma croceum F 1598]|uniref:Uncharacterized protein n=1 Tax=Piloderma croceum (strain F 1598) TaxID=765440 RepID=A0A0C3F4G5_PILCF|nr:hypothetical protein PILCRDRAFT_827841 [Piloderma croceum F 1598]